LHYLNNDHFNVIAWIQLGDNRKWRKGASFSRKGNDSFTNALAALILLIYASVVSKIDQLIDRLFTYHRWAVHVLFWCMVLFFYVVFFGRRNENYFQTFVFVGLLMPITISATYFMNYRLVPRFLMQERYGLFLLYFLYTLIAALYAEMIVSFATYIIVAKLEIKSMSIASIDIFFLLSSLLVVVFFGVGIKILLHWRKTKEDYQRLMRDKVETELKFLKTQLNPHFLFNTLNNLYFLASEKSDKAPQAILALSELLDYVLHDARADFVPLEKEVHQIKNYIGLESLRYEDRVTVNFQIVGETIAQKKIAPMLLITLVENAFKHGVMQSVDKSNITLRIECHANSIAVTCTNNIAQSNNNKMGIGLDNLKNQLSLLYDNRHTFQINASDIIYEVNLTLYES
jgi:sensor histidine kinase YesM